MSSGAVRRALRDRWIGEEERIAEILAYLRAGQDWTGCLLQDRDRRWGELAYLESCTVECLPGEAARRDLRGITLRDCSLEDSTGLGNTCLDFSTFEAVLLNNASLRGASAVEARFVSQCSLEGALLSFCDLRDASFEGAWMPRADLSNSDISGTDFFEANICGAVFCDVRFREEGLVGGFLRGRHWTQFGGGRQKAEDLDESSDPDLILYASDQIYRVLLRRRHPTTAAVARMLTNYGSSPARLCIWVAMVWLGFTLLYCTQCVRADLGWLSYVASAVKPALIDSSTREVVGSPSRLAYFSVITLTTVGFGDVVPGASDTKGQIYVCLEALSGYVLLGGFVSLLLRASLPEP